MASGRSSCAQSGQSLYLGHEKEKEKEKEEAEVEMAL
jgi:hypothetical protein